MAAYAVFRRKSGPFPCPARKHGFVAGEFGVTLEHYIVSAFFVLIVVPVHEFEIFRHACRYFFGDMSGVFAVIICAAVERTEEHIAPHHGRETVFPGNFHYAIKMFYHKRGCLFIAVSVKVFTPSDIVCFVHS